MTKELLFMGMMLTVTLCIVHRITTYQHQCTQMEDISDPFDANTYADSERLRGLPRGIIAEKTDLEMKPLLSHDRMSMPDSTMSTRRYLLAVAGVTRAARGRRVRDSWKGDRTEKVGIVDSEFVVHKGIPTLGTANKAELTAKKKSKRRGGLEADIRMDIRRHATWEEEKFNERWTRAVQEDKLWADPYQTNASPGIPFPFFLLL